MIDENNRCITCGEIIPEGRQICPKCESDSVNHPKHYNDGKIEVIDYIEDINRRILEIKRSCETWEE